MNLGYYQTIKKITVRAKRQHMRLRPYVYYKEGTLIPEKEEKHAGEGSWPSGHTSLGWTTALLLIDINPAATDGIMARAELRCTDAGRADHYRTGWQDQGGTRGRGRG